MKVLVILLLSFALAILPSNPDEWVCDDIDPDEGMNDYISINWLGYKSDILERLCNIMRPLLAGNTLDDETLLESCDKIVTRIQCKDYINY